MFKMWVDQKWKIPEEDEGRCQTARAEQSHESLRIEVRSLWEHSQAGCQAAILWGCSKLQTGCLSIECLDTLTRFNNYDNVECRCPATWSSVLASQPKLVSKMPWNSSSLRVALKRFSGPTWDRLVSCFWSKSSSPSFQEPVVYLNGQSFTPRLPDR